MPKVTFRPLPSDYQELISALKTRIAQSEKYITDFKGRHYNGTRERAVIYCLRHAVDLAKGCVVTAIEELPDSVTTLSRAALETMFWARYVTISKENAREFVDSTVNEMKRNSRKSLKAGYAKIYDIKTKEDRTREILDAPIMKEIPKRITIENAAKAGGLERVYTNIYGFISMIAHGRAFDLKLQEDYKGELYASVSAMIGALQCTEVITADWITHRKQTPRETLVEILGT